MGGRARRRGGPHGGVADSLVQGRANVLAIAYCKLSEMADTLGASRESGSLAVAGDRIAASAGQASVFTRASGPNGMPG